MPLGGTVPSQQASAPSALRSLSSDSARTRSFDGGDEVRVPRLHLVATAGGQERNGTSSSPLSASAGASPSIAGMAFNHDLGDPWGHGGPDLSWLSELSPGGHSARVKICGASWSVRSAICASAILFCVSIVTLGVAAVLVMQTPTSPPLEVPIMVPPPPPAPPAPPAPTLIRVGFAIGNWSVRDTEGILDRAAASVTCADNSGFPAAQCAATRRCTCASRRFNSDRAAFFCQDCIDGDSSSGEEGNAQTMHPGKPPAAGAAGSDLNATAEPACAHADDNEASIAATGQDCATIAANAACVLVFEHCRCTCDTVIRDGLSATGQMSNSSSCERTEGFMWPVTGALDGHDMHGRGVVSTQAATAEDCAERCRVMDGSAESAVSRRFCFSFDFSPSELTCYLGSSVVARDEPGELGHAILDSTARSFCYYERVWPVSIVRLHQQHAASNPLVGKLVQLSGVVTAVQPAGSAVFEAGFYLQQPHVHVSCGQPQGSIFVRTDRLVPRVGNLVSVTAVAYVDEAVVHLTDVVLEARLSAVVAETASSGGAPGPEVVEIKTLQRLHCEGILAVVVGTCGAMSEEGMWAVMDEAGTALVNHRNMIDTGVVMVPGAVYRIVGTVHYIDNLVVINAATVVFVAAGAG